MEWVSSHKGIEMYYGKGVYTRQQRCRFVKKMESLNVRVRRPEANRVLISLKDLNELIEQEAA